MSNFSWTSLKLKFSGDWIFAKSNSKCQFPVVFNLLSVIFNIWIELPAEICVFMMIRVFKHLPHPPMFTQEKMLVGDSNTFFCTVYLLVTMCPGLSSLILIIGYVIILISKENNGFSFQKMTRIPKVRKLPSGFIIFNSTEEARAITSRPRPVLNVKSFTKEQVHRQAVKEAKDKGFQDPDPFTLRGLYQIQFGKYRGQTFHWITENDIGYAVHLLCQIDSEGGNVGMNPLNDNKRELRVSKDLLYQPFRIYLSNLIRPKPDTYWILMLFNGHTLQGSLSISDGAGPDQQTIYISKQNPFIIIVSVVQNDNLSKCTINLADVPHWS